VVEAGVNDLPDCVGDPALLRQAFINLLSNAFKFTRHKENAVTEVDCRQQDGEKVYFVKDNGAGFDMKYAEKLFSVFQRLHSGEQFEGACAGLSGSPNETLTPQ
jgi:light-regulated signal transduction histidine kinase (bacteriophytochrome)